MIKSSEINFIKPKLNDYLIDYNELLADILVDNFSLKYLASSTINRLEAQSHFFEFLEKYVQCIQLLNHNPSLIIVITKEDYLLFKPLQEKFNNRIKKNYSNNTIKDKLLFIIFFIIHILYITIISILSRIKYKIDKNYKYIVRTYYDFRSKDKENNLRDEYFGRFIDDISQEGKTLIIYKMINKKKIFEFFRTKSNKFDFVPLEYFLNIKDIMNIIYKFCMSKIKIKNNFIYKNIDCTSLLEASLNKEFHELRGLGVYIEYYIAKKVLNIQAKTFLMPYENQTWEKMYPFVKKEINSSTKIVGYQHTGVSYKLLNYFPSKVETKLPIFPDKIVTVGSIIKNIFESKAFYPSIITVGGALRFEKHFKSSNQIKIQQCNEKINKKIVYAFSYDRNKYNAILDILCDVFKDTDIIVYLKFHPLYNEKSIIKKYSKKLPINFIASSDIEWKIIYQEVDFILYDDNSIAFEGIINGVKTFSLSNTEKIYDITRKYNFDLWDAEINKNTLYELKNSIINFTFDKSFDNSKANSYINRYFTKYDSKKYFKEFL